MGVYLCVVARRRLLRSCFSPCWGTPNCKNTAASSNLEQTGTASDVVNGSPKYFAWYELVPAGPVTITKPLVAGDIMTATVTLTGSDQYHITLVDKGRCTFSQTFTDSQGGHNSAEAIAEWASGLNSCIAHRRAGVFGLLGELDD